jgi:hypothetical protein
VRPPQPGGPPLEAGQEVRPLQPGVPPLEAGQDVRPAVAGIEGCPYQPRYVDYSHLPENMWPTLNFVLPANFQELVVGQVLVLPVRMTVQVAPPEDGL